MQFTSGIHMFSEPVEIGDGLALFKTAEIKAEATDTEPAVTLEVELRSGRYAVVRATIESPDGEVTGDHLRRIPITKLLGELNAFPAGVLQHVGEGKWQPWTPPDASVARHGPTPEALQALAEVYRVMDALGTKSPTTSAGEYFGLTRSTVGRWVMQAREAGFLPPFEATT